MANEPALRPRDIDVAIPDMGKGSDANANANANAYQYGQSSSYPQTSMGEATNESCISRKCCIITIVVLVIVVGLGIFLCVWLLTRKDSKEDSEGGSSSTSPYTVLRYKAQIQEKLTCNSLVQPQELKWDVLYTCVFASGNKGDSFFVILESMGNQTSNSTNATRIAGVAADILFANKTLTGAIGDTDGSIPIVKFTFTESTCTAWWPNQIDSLFLQLLMQLAWEQRAWIVKGFKDAKGEMQKTNQYNNISTMTVSNLTQLSVNKAVSFQLYSDSVNNTNAQGELQNFFSRLNTTTMVFNLPQSAPVDSYDLLTIGSLPLKYRIHGGEKYKQTFTYNDSFGVVYNFMGKDYLAQGNYSGVTLWGKRLEMLGFETSLEILIERSSAVTSQIPLTANVNMRARYAQEGQVLSIYHAGTLLDLQANYHL